MASGTKNTPSTHARGPSGLVVAEEESPDGARPLSAQLLRASNIRPLLVLALGVYGFFFFPSHILYASSLALAMGLVGLGLFVPLATMREMPLHAAGLAGLAAYWFAYHASSGGPFQNFIGIGGAFVVVAGLSVLGGAASLVVTGLYFVVTSLVIQMGVEKVVFSIGSFTGGAGGRSVAQPDWHGWLYQQRAIYLIAAIVAVVCTLAVRWFLRSRPGLHAFLVGQVPDGAQAVGIRNWMTKLLVFGVSGLLIAVGGLLIAFVNGTPPPPQVQFNVVWSVIFLAIPIAGGMKDLSSLWLVAGALTALPVMLEKHAINSSLLSGSILLGGIFINQSRAALGNGVRNLFGRVRGEDEEEIVLADVVSDAPAAGSNGAGLAVRSAVIVLDGTRPPAHGRDLVALEGRNLTVDFGGVRAVADMSIRVAPGDRVGVVGANGAGKTTMFNALTGFVPLAEGQVFLGDRDITNLPPYARARAGIRRTFQLPRVADMLTIRQNIGCGHRTGAPAERRERADWLLSHFGLSAQADLVLGSLPFGQRRKVEMVRALLEVPDALLIDEPVSGLEDHEVTELVELLVDLQAVEGWGLLAIEHDLSFVTRIAEHLVVMVDGVVLTDGPTTQVLGDERVRRIYLGEAVAV